MKLIQMNVWHYRLYWPLRRFFEAERPDFILVQESVEAGTYIPFDSYTASSLVTEGIARVHLQAPGAAFDVRGGVSRSIGQAILSNHPLALVAAVDILSPEDVAAKPLLGMHQLLHATTQINGKTLNLISYHNPVVVDRSLPHEGRLGTPDAERNFLKVADYLRAVKEPIIFTGDFNLWPEAPVLAPVAALGLRNLVTPAMMPYGRNGMAWKTDEIVSHCFVSPDIKVLDFRVAPELVSDHQPLVLEFDL